MEHDLTIVTGEDLDKVFKTFRAFAEEYPEANIVRSPEKYAYRLSNEGQRLYAAEIKKLLLSEKGNIVSMWTPEIDLVPSNQAELGTTLAMLAGAKWGQYFLYTDSDLIMDRVRMHVRQGDLASSSVIILWCDKEDPRPRPVRIAKDGSPSGGGMDYRRFHIDEQDRFFQMKPLKMRGLCNKEGCRAKETIDNLCSRCLQEEMIANG